MTALIDQLLRREATDGWCHGLIADRGVWAQVKASEKVLGCLRTGSRAERYERVTARFAMLRQAAMHPAPGVSMTDALLARGAWERVEHQAGKLTQAQRDYFARNG